MSGCDAIGTLSSTQRWYQPLSNSCRQSTSIHNRYRSLSVGRQAKKDAKSQVVKVLNDLNREEADIEAIAFEQKLGPVERIDRMIAMSERRRNSLLLDIERRRETFPARPSKGLNEIEAEFEEVAKVK